MGLAQMSSLRLYFIIVGTVKYFLTTYSITSFIRTPMDPLRFLLFIRKFVLTVFVLTRLHCIMFDLASIGFALFFIPVLKCCLQVILLQIYYYIQLLCILLSFTLFSNVIILFVCLVILICGYAITLSPTSRNGFNSSSYTYMSFFVMYY